MSLLMVLKRVIRDRAAVLTPLSVCFLYCTKSYSDTIKILQQSDVIKIIQQTDVIKILQQSDVIKIIQQSSVIKSAL